MTTSPQDATPLDLDVLIVGAGLSGIGMACRLARHRPQDSWAVLEARDALGGTWDLFRYPGARSDSDMYTLGFPFRPWRGRSSIAPAQEVLDYLRDTARAYGVTDRVHYGQRVIRLQWSGERRRWTVVSRTAAGQVVEHTARFVQLATGYYSYDSGHVVEFLGQSEFTGRVVHPQQWPPDLDVTGRRVVVVGSGATAVTLVPALVAHGAEHVTMLQRSPGYVASLASRDPVADVARRLLPAGVAHRVVRAKNIALTSLSYAALRRWPRAGRRVLQRRLRRSLPEGYPVEVHFDPDYEPWDQRLCVVPDGDLLDALASGEAEVVTAHVQGFVPEGVRLASGEVLAADVVVTATGLRLEIAGGAELVVDGTPVPVSSTHVYRGCMFSGVPNLALSMGYVNASWTLRADLTARWVCSLLDHLDARGLQVATPRYRGSPSGSDPGLLDLTSGYVRRGEHLLPRQGRAAPWRVVQSYPREVLAGWVARFDDGVLEFR